MQEGAQKSQVFYFLDSAQFSWLLHFLDCIKFLSVSEGFQKPYNFPWSTEYKKPWYRRVLTLIQGTLLLNLLFDFEESMYTEINMYTLLLQSELIESNAVWSDKIIAFHCNVGC